MYVLRSLTRRVLYIGITRREPRHRWVEHARDKPWWPQVAFKQVESRHRRLAAAERRERTLIAQLNPLYNIEHNDLGNVPRWYLRQRARRQNHPILDAITFWGPLLLVAVLFAGRGPTDRLTITAAALAVIVILWPAKRRS